MGIKNTFTDDEWQQLLSFPYAVSFAIVTVAPTWLDAVREVDAIATEPARLAVASKSDLVAIVSCEMQFRADELTTQQQDLFRRDELGYRTKIIEASKAASAILAKSAPEDATAYKKWVLAIAQKVAESDKLKGVPLSEQEQAVLSQVSAALGVSS